jgi:predicted Na+-dependent transporter
MKILLIAGWITAVFAAIAFAQGEPFSMFEFAVVYLLAQLTLKGN